MGDALFTKTQQRLLSLLYGRPDKSFYTNEIVRWANMGRGTVSRELERMSKAGLLKVTRAGNQQHYQADPDCPIYKELLSIVKKTFGISGTIQSALQPLADQIIWAFIFGSVASGKEGTDSDIDLLLIGEIGFADVVAKLYPLQEELGREINPKIYSQEEWMQMQTDKDAFVKELMAKPRMDVMGDGHEFR